MRLESSIGQAGTFYYPKLDLVATTMLLKDVAGLPTAMDEEKKSIISIRENLTTIRDEELRGKKITIHYDIKIPHLDQWDLQQIIANAESIMLNAAVSDKDWDLI
jgi:hypothetical protein